MSKASLRIKSETQRNNSVSAKKENMKSESSEKIGKKAAHGTQEWAAYNVNCCQNCSNSCKYCYAKCMAIRFGRSTPESWKKVQIRKEVLKKSFNKRDGTIMFPTSHDILPENVDACIQVLASILRSGNRVLIVSKPNYECIKRVCSELKEFQSQILLRFTIGSADDKVLKFWEPGAPPYKDRIKAIKYAYDHGFETSLSCEPMLDGNIDAVIKAAKPYITDSIWLGIANRLRQTLSINCPGDRKVHEKATELMDLQNDEWVRRLYEKYQKDPLIKWKDSIKKIMGLERPTGKGLDV